MDYAKRYINFINGRYASEGVRITAGIVLPSLLLYYFDALPIGLVMSFGALCVSVADTPGAARHRINGMLATSILVSCLHLGIYFAANYAWLLAIIIQVSGFAFSMLTVYGNRSSAVGIAALLMIVLSLQDAVGELNIWQSSCYTLAGGVWYMLYSLVLYRLRPYKFIQQVLGDYIITVGNYLRQRAGLYQPQPNYQQINEQLIYLQVKVEEQQNLLNELLYNTRTIVKESTHVGRVLIKIFLEVAELFESIMTSYQQYPELHQAFDDTGILGDIGSIATDIAEELDKVGLAIKSGYVSRFDNAILENIELVKSKFEKLRYEYMAKRGNPEAFVSLGRIIKNLQDMQDRLLSLQQYSTYSVPVKKGEASAALYRSFVPKTNLRPTLFLNNLHFGSNIFRHALRMGLALLLGYVVSLFFKVDRGYWILLTIVVILKPAYSLSKQRNYDRLVGTALGILIGFLLVYFIKSPTALLFLMVLMMAVCYSFIRTNYFLSVLFMTPYLLLFFHLLYPYNINEIITERLIDTAIGSVIALAASLFLVPAWESASIKPLMAASLKACNRYFELLAQSFSSSQAVDVIQFKTLRKETMIALANLSDAFNRMLSEPRRFRQGSQYIHRFVVLNQSLVSHLATLAYFLQAKKIAYRSAALLPVKEQTQNVFENSIQLLQNENAAFTLPEKTALRSLNELLAGLVLIRKNELAQGQMETPTKRLLIETQSVTDQFNYLFNDANAMFKVIQDYQKQMKAPDEHSLLKNPLDILDV